MTINEFYEFVNFCARKSQSGSNPAPDVFNNAVIRAFVEWVMKQYGNPSDYSVGNPIPRVAWQQNQVVSDRLHFLLERREFIVPSTGKLTLPDGTTIKDVNTAVCPKYLHASSMRTTYITQIDGVLDATEVDVTPLRDNEIGSVLSSSIKAPTHRYPVCAMYKDYIQLYPKNIGRVTFTYLRTPTAPVWGYKVVNNRPVYDASTSVNIESPDETHNEIAMQTLSYLGISIREPQLIQYAEQMKQA